MSADQISAGDFLSIDVGTRNLGITLLRIGNESQPVKLLNYWLLDLESNESIDAITNLKPWVEENVSLFKQVDRIVIESQITSTAQIIRFEGALIGLFTGFIWLGVFKDVTYIESFPSNLRANYVKQTLGIPYRQKLTHLQRKQKSVQVVSQMSSWMSDYGVLEMLNLNLKKNDDLAESYLQGVLQIFKDFPIVEKWTTVKRADLHWSLQSKEQVAVGVA